MNWWLLGGAIVVGFLISLVAVKLSISLSHRFDALDYPDADRKTQARPIPKLGGLAVAVAFSVTILLALAFIDVPGELRLTLGVLAPALFAGFVGYLDDRRHLNPYLRLALQAVTGASVWLVGTQVNAFGSNWLDGVVAILFVMVVINGLNLLDNSDGLAASTVLVSGIAASVIALMAQQELVSLLGFALVGITLGFLRWNWHPARVYLGDSGAYFLATLLAVLVMRLKPEQVDPPEGILIALLLVLLPIVDTTYVVMKRLRAGIHPFTAGRDHLSHHLQGRGKTVPKSVVLLQSVSIGGALAAILISLW